MVVELIHQCYKPASLNDKKHPIHKLSMDHMISLKHSWVGLNSQARQLVTGENPVGKW